MVPVRRLPKEKPLTALSRRTGFTLLVVAGDEKTNIESCRSEGDFRPPRSPELHTLIPWRRHDGRNLNNRSEPYNVK